MKTKLKLIIISTFFLILFLAIGLNGMNFKVNKFEKLLSDFQAEESPVYDLRMNYCTVLRVESEVKTGLTLGQKVYKKIIINPGEYYFYISAHEDEITFKAPNYNSKTIKVPRKGLKMGKVYYVRLESVKEPVVTKQQPKIPKKMPIVQDKSSKSTLLITKQGIEFELTQCFYASEAITMVFDVTNHKADREISLVERAKTGYVRIIDDKGMEYRSSKMTFGTKSGHYHSNGIKDVTVVEDVTTQLIYNFENIKNNPKYIKRMDILMFIPEYNSYFTLKFRDIEIQY